MSPVIDPELLKYLATNAEYLRNVTQNAPQETPQNVSQNAPANTALPIPTETLRNALATKAGYANGIGANIDEVPSTTKPLSITPYSAPVMPATELQKKYAIDEANYENKPPSTLRKWLGNIAGGALGAITLNPMLGMAVAHTIHNSPNHEALKEFERKVKALNPAVGAEEKQQTEGTANYRAMLAAGGLQNKLKSEEDLADYRNRMATNAEKKALVPKTSVVTPITFTDPTGQQDLTLNKRGDQYFETSDIKYENPVAIPTGYLRKVAFFPKSMEGDITPATFAANVSLGKIYNNGRGVPFTNIPAGQVLRERIINGKSVYEMVGEGQMLRPSGEDLVLGGRTSGTPTTIAGPRIPTSNITPAGAEVDPATGEFVFKGSVRRGVGTVNNANPSSTKGTNVSGIKNQDDQSVRLPLQVVRSYLGNAAKINEALTSVITGDPKTGKKSLASYADLADDAGARQRIGSVMLLLRSDLSKVAAGQQTSINGWNAGAGAGAGTGSISGGISGSNINAAPNLSLETAARSNAQIATGLARLTSREKTYVNDALKAYEAVLGTRAVVGGTATHQSGEALTNTLPMIGINTNDSKTFKANLKNWQSEFKNIIPLGGPFIRKDLKEEFDKYNTEGSNIDSSTPKYKFKRVQ